MTTSESSPPAAPAATRSAIWSRPLAAARANLLPGLVLQAFAVAVILAYYLHAPTRGLLDEVAAFKARAGYPFSFLATAVFGGLVPFLCMRLDRRTRASTPLAYGVFLLLFWGYKGVEVDAFYRFQGWLFGGTVDFPTVAKKVVVDMFVYCPVWSMPVTVLAFHWKENGFRFEALRRLDKVAYLRATLPTALITTWSIWLPAVIMIYSLPGPLQIPLFDIVLCFYSLVFFTLTRRPGA